MKVDNIWMANTLQNINLLGEFGELVLGGLKAVPSNLDAFFSIQCFPNYLVGTFT